MNIKDITRTKGGHPWRFYADGGAGYFPIHGAIFINGWQVTEHTKEGKHPRDENFDLDLTDWRDQIPWDRLVDEIVVVTWDSYHGLRGYDHEPKCCSKTCLWFSSKGKFWLLTCIKMPHSPDNWRQAIARRPE